MVWVVEGTLNSDKDDPPDALPPSSSHFLRPSRVYKVGRMGGVRAPAKPSAGGKLGPASKHRPYDFRIASLGISKEGMCEFETGGEDWDPEDNPDSPSNGDPYPLTVRVNKKLRLTRVNGEQVDVSAQAVHVEDGDHFQEPSKGYWFRFTWVPLFFCFNTAAVNQKKEYLAEGKKLGVKIAFKTFRPHHTHFLMKSASPTVHLLRAAVAPAHVVSPTFFTELVARSSCPPRPSEPLPAHPGPPPPAGTDKDGMAAYDKSVALWEKNLLALNEDVGADWSRWWGHSFLEKDWESAWPGEGEYPPERAAAAKEWDPRRWAREGKRARLFEGCLFVSFRGNASQDEADADIVRAASGSFFASSLLQRSPLPSIDEVLSAIADFSDEHPAAAAADGATKVVLSPPGEVFEAEEGDEVVAGQLELLKELQRRLQVGKLCQGAELAQAVYHVDTASLFGNEVPAAGAPSQEQQSGSSSHRRTQRTATTQASQFTQATPPFPTGGVPGTHPESGQPPPAASMDVEGGPAAGEGSASANASQEGGESAPSQPRKLKRRARTGRDVFEDMFEDIGSSAAVGGAGSSRAPLTQEEVGSSGVAGPSSARMDAEPATPANPPAPTGRTTTLKRRAGKKDIFAAMFGEDSPEKSGGGDDDSASAQTQAGQDDWKRKGKTRQERMQAIEEEDRRLAQEEAEQTQAAGAGKKGKGRALDVVDEDEEEEGGAGAAARRKKRDKSAAIGSGDSDEDRQPARKRATKKEGAAPVSTTSKRTRGQSREPTAGASSEEDESARPAARKKAKAATDEPKSKKEAEKEAKEQENAKLLQIKTSKRKGAEVDQAFSEDFNALKIVKPRLKAMPRVEKHRMDWDDNDSDVERHERLIREDQQRLAAAADEDDEDMDPDHWRRPTQAMFVVRTMEVERKERPAPRSDIELDEKWAGKPNFKKFRPKNAKGPRQPLAQRPQIQLVVPDAVDFGLGEGYNDRQGTAFSQVQQADDEDDEEDLLRSMTTDKGQIKLTFGAAKGKAKAKAKAPAKKPAASKAKGKGKAKQVVVDSEEEEEHQLASNDDVRSSNTLRADEMDLDDDDDDDGAPPSRSSTTSKKKAPARAPRKAAAGPATIIIDDDSDSDSGMTFKGFGKKSAGAARARR
ncbi:hypothetical protein JCM6882_002478 [Rhodosporidiobolus microsporus]